MWNWWVPEGSELFAGAWVGSQYLRGQRTYLVWELWCWGDAAGWTGNAVGRNCSGMKRWWEIRKLSFCQEMWRGGKWVLVPLLPPVTVWVCAAPWSCWGAVVQFLTMSSCFSVFIPGYLFFPHVTPVLHEWSDSCLSEVGMVTWLGS